MIVYIVGNSTGNGSVTANTNLLTVVKVQVSGDVIGTGSITAETSLTIDIVTIHLTGSVVSSSSVVGLGAKLINPNFVSISGAVFCTCIAKGVTLIHGDALTTTTVSATATLVEVINTPITGTAQGAGSVTANPIINTNKNNLLDFDAGFILGLELGMGYGGQIGDYAVGDTILSTSLELVSKQPNGTRSYEIIS